MALYEEMCFVDDNNKESSRVLRATCRESFPWELVLLAICLRDAYIGSPAGLAPMSWRFFQAYRHGLANKNGTFPINARSAMKNELLLSLIFAVTCSLDIGFIVSAEME